MSQKPQTVDVTPTPRILRTLGDIPFDAWQCFAELADNSIDAFKESASKGVKIDAPRIDIYWSPETVPAHQREIIVQDNGPGMTLETVQKAAKAGYSSNDPIHNLGLFGMGFNIATARLGDETLLMSATPDSSEWVGVKLDFEELIKTQTFAALVVREPKKNPDEQGTRVVIRKLKDGVYADLKRKFTTVKRRMEHVYTPLLDKKEIEVYIQGKQLSAKPHCVWSESRFVMRKGNRVAAVQRIDRDLGETYFDLSRNRYLTEDETDELDLRVSRGEAMPENITKRSRRLKGWIGIQRYSDPADFGLDFIRNGRKILVADKALFSFENPETGTPTQEYPVELGSTVGGRIVGELHVDYLIPTYQKNGFDTTDRAWRLTVEAIRGAGPMLPQKRSAMGYDGDNDSPLGVLVNAYRRADPGTKNLAIPNALAKEYAKEFRNGNVDYVPDEKWYKTAQEADRDRGDGEGSGTPVNTGDMASDDVGQYGPSEGDDASPSTPNAGATPTQPPPVPQSSERDQLIKASERSASLSGKYAYGATPSIQVTAWRVKDTQIRLNGNRVPYAMFQDGVDVDFFFDPQNFVLDEYPITSKQLLLLGLAEKFAIRDHNVTLLQAYIGLIANHLQDERINAHALYERAQSVMGAIREKLPKILAHRLSKALEIISEVPAEEEELAKKLLDEAPAILAAYQNKTSEAVASLSYVTDATIVRLVNFFPEEFLDGKLFDLPYASINIGRDDTKERLRRISIEKIVSYLKDVSVLMQGGKQLSKHELIRNSNTLAILESRLV